MSPVSRGRKPSKKTQNKNQTKRAAQPGPPPADCDCPLCTGTEQGVDALLDDLLLAIADQHDSADPLGAELIGASVIAFGELVEDGGEVGEMFAKVLLPALEARANADALALLLAIGAVSAEDGQHVAMAAADRLVARGLPLPTWANELAEPVTLDSCLRLADPDAEISVLFGSFRRAAHTSTFVVTVDHNNCSAADHITMVDAEHLADMVREVQAGARRDGIELDQQQPDPAEFRWHLVTALNARAAHDQEFGPEPPEDDDPDAPPYPVLAALLHARASNLPASEAPPAEHQHAGAPIQPAVPTPDHTGPAPVTGSR